MEFLVDELDVILVDDVLYSGRTIQAALQALTHYGRACSVELLVLIDRRFNRCLPIQGQYIGLKVDSLDQAYVKVELEEEGLEDRVLFLTQIIKSRMTEQALSSRHLLGIKDLSVQDIQLILKTAEQFKEVINRPIKKVPSLRDITIANLFLKILPGPSYHLNWLKKTFCRHYQF